MKQYLFIFAVMLTTQIHAQVATPCQPNNDYDVYPNSYNSFINGPAISWAGQAEGNADVAFGDHKFDKYTNIYDYIIAAQKSGKVKSYITRVWDPAVLSGTGNDKPKAKNNNEFYIEVNKHYGRKGPSYSIDSLKNIHFDQVYFIQGHKLRSYIIAAAPEYQVFTSEGMYVGNTLISFTAINKNSAAAADKNDKIVLLKTTAQVLRFDSLPNITPIKETYGMNLVYTLWYDLSKGYNKAIDLKTNKRIPAKNIMEYSGTDSIEEVMQGGDDTTNIYYKVAGTPIRRNLSEISVSQNWYYDVTKNIFYTSITDATIYAKEYDDQGVVTGDNPRIKILFK
jgi:hypothetical protein